MFPVFNYYYWRCFLSRRVCNRVRVNFLRHKYLLAIPPWSVCLFNVKVYLQHCPISYYCCRKSKTFHRTLQNIYFAKITLLYSEERDFGCKSRSESLMGILKCSLHCDVMYVAIGCVKCSIVFWIFFSRYFFSWHAKCKFTYKPYKCDRNILLAPWMNKTFWEQYPIM